MGKRKDGYPAPVKGEDIPREQEIFMTAWGLLKAFYNVDSKTPNVVYEELLDKAVVISEIGRDTPTEILAVGISTAVMETIQALLTVRKGEHYKTLREQQEERMREEENTA